MRPPCDGPRPALVARGALHPRLLLRVLGRPEHAGVGVGVGGPRLRQRPRDHRHRAMAAHLQRAMRCREAFLDYRGFIEFWNLFYGTFHFFVTIGALLWLFRRFPERYPKWRNVLACTTARGARRLRALSAPAAAPAAARRSASSTRSACTAASGRSTRVPCTRSPTSTRPCRACTSVGRHGARSCSSPRCRARG